MGKKKEKKAPEGAPDWMVTYGDMMTLLFCFFVIIVSMSEIKKDIEFEKVLESIREAFGYKGGAGKLPSPTAPKNSTIKPMTQLILRKFQLQIGKSADEGIEGENPSVTKIREGMEFTSGGIVMFAPGKAQLLEPAKVELNDFIDVIIGMNTKLRVKGHANRESPEVYAPFKDLDDLSYARAKAVKEYLISKGVREHRITIEACGASEPLRSQPYDPPNKAQNRRVSIIATEKIVDEYKGQPYDSDDKQL